MPSHSTLLAITVFTPALAGCLLLLSWLQHRRVVALALWGSGFVTASVATTLIIVVRGTISDFWSIIVGNALLAAAYGICGLERESSRARTSQSCWHWWSCSDSRLLDRPHLCAAGSPGDGDSGNRNCLHLARRLRTVAGRGDDVWRWPVIVLLLAHAAAIPIHIPLAGALTHPDPSDVDLLTFAIFEGAFVCMCTAYLFGGLAKDRIAARYRRASLTDPLTGVANRRGFFEAGKRLLKRARFARQPTALIMFDLDRFKSINDRYGHHTGDEVLTAFCRLATSQLRPNDLFGRIGGEEFASLLPDTGHHDAIRLAERVRSAVETSSHAFGHDAIDLTVSVGVAIADMELQISAR